MKDESRQDPPSASSFILLPSSFRSRRPELAGLPVLALSEREPTPEDQGQLEGRIREVLRKDRLLGETLRERLQALGLTRGP